jgi:hypothetical protein
MKRVFYLALVFVVLVVGIVVFKAEFLSTAANAEELQISYYPAVGKITGFCEEYDVVFMQTHDGNEWAFLGIEDWAVGDNCCMVFCDEGTPSNVHDDTIVAVRYFA